MSVTHDDLQQQLLDGQGRMGRIETQLSEIASHVSCIPEMRKDLAETRGIVEAWDAAKNVARFIKWIGGVAAALAAIWIFVKAAAKGLLQ